MKNELDELRKKIDEIDEKTAKLFEERMNAVREISAYKRARGIAVLDEKREADIIKKNAEHVTDLEIREYYPPFISTVMKLSRDMQIRQTEGLRVAYSDTQDALGRSAAKKAFPNAKLFASDTTEQAYAGVEKGEYDCAVLPFVNENCGNESSVADLAFFGNLYVNAVVEIEANDCENPSASLTKNAKRFAVFSRVQHLPSPEDPSEKLHFLLAFTAKNEAGSLAKALNVVAAHDFNLRTLVSRPVKSLLWNNYFYAETDGNVATENGKEMMQELSAVCAQLKLVGTYR